MLDDPPEVLGTNGHHTQDQPSVDCLYMLHLGGMIYPMKLPLFLLYVILLCGMFVLSTCSIYMLIASVLVCLLQLYFVLFLYGGMAKLNIWVNG